MEAHGKEGHAVAALCRRASISRQAVYKARKRRSVREVQEELTVHLVQRVRAEHPRLGARKLLHRITPELLEAGVVAPGRDAFFALLGRKGLLIEKKRAFVPRTTDSRHRFALHGNLLMKEGCEEPRGPGELWLSDLTYLRTEEGFCYLALVMDGYSRKVVGFHASASLEMEGALLALRMAQKSLLPGQAPIHHSDRGCQYACHAYVEELMRLGCRVSMTEENHCYENAKAERLNGILKHEYGLCATFKTRKEAERAAKQAVYLYNTGRPHLMLEMKTPEEAHRDAA